MFEFKGDGPCLDAIKWYFFYLSKSLEGDHMVSFESDSIVEVALVEKCCPTHPCFYCQSHQRVIKVEMVN